MSYVLNNPESFAQESTDGFVAAYRGLVRRVHGGVARATSTPAGQVALVIGGGSGHYPAFAGLVGPGLAHGAAMGNIFASPSAQQVYNVAKAVASDAGVLLSYGNYAGDALNFDQAQERLRAEGIACQTVRVTDDIYSAPPSEPQKRRGIAGDLSVFRAAGWAIEQGWSLDQVAAFASRANDRTRSAGVAFSGCTLPGASEPLFTVPSGQMAVGMGIHGEPGIDIVPMATARQLGELLVGRLLEERPEGVEQDARVGLILNGLGSVKAEELFVLYGAVAADLEGVGITIVEPEVGEYATSFEMAGVSLTLTWLEAQLEEAWLAPAYSAAYRKGSVDLTLVSAAARNDVETGAATEQLVSAVPESVAVGEVVRDLLHAIRDVIDRDADELGRLDAIAGDGDHGIGMQRGARGAADAADVAVAAGAGAGTVLAMAGDAWADRAGGTSGALWGVGLRAVGEMIGDQAAPDAITTSAAMAAALDAVQALGKAKIGDKTLVDALVPFVDSLRRRVEAGDGLAAAWAAAAHDATDAAQATTELLPRIGRARPHMEKSLGTPDPGAVSLALAVTAAGAVLTEKKGH